MDKSKKIENGVWVLVRRGDYQRVVQFDSNGFLTFGKGGGQHDIQLRNAEGEEFYTAFRIVPQPTTTTPSVPPPRGRRGGPRMEKKIFTLEKVDEPVAKSFNSLAFIAPPDLGSGKDNRNIFDDKAQPSQPLGEGDILELKDAGRSADEILATLVSASTSFALKTEFSQEKYLKKKEKVHGDLLLVLPTDLSLLTEYFFKKDPLKTLGLRLDSLSQVLAYGNVHAGGKYLVFEGAGGLLVGGMLERMGGFGSLLHCHSGSCPGKQALQYLNLSPGVMAPYKSLDAFYLRKSPEEGAMTVVTSGEPEEVTILDGEPKAKKVKIQEEPIESVNRDGNKASLSILNSTLWEGLLIAAKEHPLTIVQRLLPHVLPSSPFVVFSSFPEPLMEVFMMLKEKGLGTNMSIVDNWMRVMQIETERTHPEVGMSSSGGYILSGTIVSECTTTTTTSGTKSS